MADCVDCQIDIWQFKPLGTIIGDSPILRWKKKKYVKKNGTRKVGQNDERLTEFGYRVTRVGLPPCLPDSNNWAAAHAGGTLQRSRKLRSLCSRQLYAVINCQLPLLLWNTITVFLLFCSGCETENWKNRFYVVVRYARESFSITNEQLMLHNLYSCSCCVEKIINSSWGAVDLYESRYNLSCVFERISKRLHSILLFLTILDCVWFIK